MKCLQPIKLAAAPGVQGTWTIPANTQRLDIVNLSNSPIRIAFVADVVAVSPLVFPYEYETVAPMKHGDTEPHSMTPTSGTLYYSSNWKNALFTVTPYI